MTSAGWGGAFRQLRALFNGRSVVGVEDGQLLARFATDRDEAAFEALIERHGPMVLSTCRAVLRNEQDVEDAFQATFLVLARRAGSIRGADSLGGWLHRVAYRASLQAGSEAARRRRTEAEAQAMAAKRTQNPQLDRETHALLHAEISALPESQQLPIILCDLEGLTYEQAAAQLEWTVPTLRNRLARGRQRLKARLTRRGLATPSLLALLAPKALSPLPLGLLRSTLSAATGGASSTGAAFLAQTLVKGMLMTKLKLAGTATLAILALISAGFLAKGSGKSQDEPKLAPKPASRVEVAIPEAKKPPEPIEVRGIVVDPDGKPVAGAKVWANVVNQPPETMSGPDGRFLLMIRPRDPSLNIDETYPCVMTLAPGFGIGWVKKAFEPGPTGELTVRLVAEGPPIEGRILDSENRPVAGALVKVRDVWVDGQLSFPEWIDKAKAKEVQSPLLRLFNLRLLWPLEITTGPDGRSRAIVGTKTPIETATGPDGRFRLTGIGGDRVATLIVSGPMIATTEINVLDYDGPEIETAPPTARNQIRFTPPQTAVFHAPKFEAVVGPSRPIEGVIRDKDTGRPIEGLMIHAGVLDRLDLRFRMENLLSVTDAQGRYQIKGMPRADSYSLEITRTLHQALPYANATLKTPDAQGPIHFDIALKRAVVVRGRITDKTTGHPVLGRVETYVFDDVESPASRPNIGSTDADGRFEIVTPPGRVLLAFRATRESYLTGLGMRDIKGFDPAQERIRIRNGSLIARQYHALAEVNLDPKAESATVNLQVDPGGNLELKVVDPEGQSVEGLRVEGTSPRYVNFAVPEKGPSVKIWGLDASKPRRVTIFQDARKLVGSVWLKGNETGTMTVRLGPWGTIVGRFVDRDGKGLGPWKIFSSADAQGPQAEEVGYLPGMMVSPGLMTDAEGRFRIEGLVPGLKYTAQVDAFDSPEIDNVVVQPGEVKNLGEIKAWWRKPR